MKFDRSRIYRYPIEIANINPSTISFTQLKLMQSDPFIAIGLSVDKMPILSAKYSLEILNDSVPDNIVKYVQEKIIDRFLYRLLKIGLYAIDFGYVVTEKVFDVEDGFLVYKKLVDIEPSQSHTILVDENGDYNGYKGYDYIGQFIIPPEKSWLHTYDYSFGNYYGRPLLKNIYIPWRNCEVTTLNYQRHIEYNGSPANVIYYDPRKDGTSQKYQGIALQIAKDLAYKKQIVVPSKYDENKNRMWEVTTVGGDLDGNSFVSAIRYYNQQKLLGLMIPPQVVLRDSETGSFAEGSVKLNLTMMLIEGIQKELLEGINKYIVAPMIKENFSEKYINDIKIISEPLQDTTKEALDGFSKEILKSNSSQDLINVANQYMLEQFGEIYSDVLDKSNNEDKEQTQEENSAI